MSVLQWNLRGIKSNEQDLKAIMNTYNSDIILLQETKLKEQDVYKVNGFKSFCRNVRCASNQIAHGGVAILVRENLNPVRIHLNTDLQAVAVRIHLTSPIIFCSFYVQEKDNVSKAEIQKLLDQLGNQFVLGGDFNAHSPMWNHDNYNVLGSIIEDLMQENDDLLLLNSDEATYFNKRYQKWSTLDLTFYSGKNYGNIQWHTHEDLANSDHLPIIFYMIPPRMHEITQPERNFQESKADWASFQRKTAILDFSNYNISSVESFGSQIIKIAEKTIPRNSGKVHRKVVPWWNDEISGAVKSRKRSLRRLRRNNTIQNLIKLNRDTAKAKLLIRQGKRKATEELCNSISVNTPIKKIFLNVRKLQGASTRKNISMLKIQEEMITDSKEIANVLVDQFCKASSNQNYSFAFRRTKYSREQVPIYIPEYDNDINSEFSMLELNSALQTCKGKSSGHNRISYGMLKNLHPSAKKNLLNIYNFLWKERVWPETWNHAITIPLPKPGKCSFDPDSKRPISLTCVDSKVFEKMSMNRLNWWLEENKCFDDSQNGFRRGRSISDNLTILHRILVQGLKDGYHSLCIFFDLKKAYDRIWRRLVVEKLIDWGLGGNIVHMVSNFLKNRTMQVKCNGTYSITKALDNGVPQGSVAAVTCFLVALADFEKELKYSFQSRYPSFQLTLLSYADDKAAIVTGANNDPNLAQALQFVGEFTNNWMKRCGQALSPEKTQILHCCSKKKCKKISVTIDEQTIFEQRVIKFLGVFIDKGLRWRQHIIDRKTKCIKALSAIRMLANPKYQADTNILVRIIHSVITSRLLFGSEIFYGTAKSNIKSLNTIYVAALRSALGAYRTSPLSSIIFESQQLSFEHQIIQKNLRYGINSLLKKHLDKYQLTKKMDFGRYKVLGDICEENFNEIQLNQISNHLKDKGPPPWSFKEFKIDLTMSNFDKSSTPPLRLKRTAEYLIRKNNTDTQLFTDGSFDGIRTGFAVVYENNIASERLMDFTSIFTAEMSAILKAIELATAIEGRCSIITDSLSSLLAIQNLKTKDPLTKTIQSILAENSDKLSFIFVHSHIGIEGNETADAEAKKALDFTNPTDLTVTLNDLGKRIKKLMSQLRKDEWESLEDSHKLKTHTQIIPDNRDYKLENRKDDRIISRLRIGHTRYTHSYMLKSPHVIPTCEVCQVPITVNHILIECSKYESCRRDLSVENTLTGIFKPNIANSVKLIEFIKKIGLYGEI